MTLEMINDIQTESLTSDKYSLQGHVTLDDNEINYNFIYFNSCKDSMLNDSSFPIKKNEDTVIIPYYVINEYDTSAIYLSSNVNNIFIKKILKNNYYPKFIRIYLIKSKILELQKIGDIEKTLDYIFNTFDDLIFEEQFQIINNLLEMIEVNEISIDNLVGILTITSSRKKEITSRSSFYRRAHEYINELYQSEDISQILGGLE